MVRLGEPVRGLLLLGMAAGLAGCAYLPRRGTPGRGAELGQEHEEIRWLRSAIDQLDRPPASPPATRIAEPELLPPEARPGECYARVFVPPIYRTEVSQVATQEEYEAVEVVPARHEWADERVMVKGPSEKLETAEAEFEWVEERIMVSPPGKRVEEVPAEYAWAEEKVMVKPAHTVWQRGSGAIQRIDNATGEIMCRVEVPPVFETVRKRVLVKPASTRVVEVEAVYQTVRKQVMRKPPSVTRIEVPPEYTTVKVQRLVAPEEKRVVRVPARYKTVTRNVVVSDGRIAWRRVLCETNLSRAMIEKIQTALLIAGHDPGFVDGILGPNTRQAVEAYQTAKGLAIGGLTYETLKSLGVPVDGAVPGP